MVKRRYNKFVAFCFFYSMVAAVMSIVYIFIGEESNRAVVGLLGCIGCLAITVLCFLWVKVRTPADELGRTLFRCWMQGLLVTVKICLYVSIIGIFLGARGIGTDKYSGEVIYDESTGQARDAKTGRVVHGDIVDQYTGNTRHV
ncbi:hypothetical protein [Bifidobacterium vansinderenii]|uniref:Uncharacterized protein n=1 Tax=Bifidobacterium vansinderenii TaxID=1984871 RepID=A0A229VWV1_9BIFI|nr:hypothetical protein [Bifidobacterium vansinderenii]OXN00083.1 hypothetical protein Tam10B_1656 [Bifidobacterium vansinderenii]